VPFGPRRIIWDRFVNLLREPGEVQALYRAISPSTGRTPVADSASARICDCGTARVKASARIAPSVRPGIGTCSNAPSTPNTS
jgi:hypothetical protein